MATVTAALRRALRASSESRYRICLVTGIDKAVLSRFAAGGRLYSDNLDLLARHLGLELRPKDQRARKGRTA